jgi:hypothetical protein
MTTTRNRRITAGAITAAQAFAAQADALEARIAGLTMQLETLREGAAANPLDWGYAGTADYWNEKLAEILGEEY